jgi:hypothetical protein
LGYVAVFFVMLTWERIHTFLSATNYVPLITIYVANFLIVKLSLFSKKKHQKGENSQTQKSE